MRTILALLGLVVVEFFMAGKIHAQPCPDLPPLGLEFTCYFMNSAKVVVFPSHPELCNSIGSATVRIVGHNYNPCEAILQVEQFSSNVPCNSYPLTIELMPSLIDSRLTGQAIGTLFPATLQINMYLKAGSFLASEPLTLFASNITQLPLHDVSVEQAQPVTFYDGFNFFIVEESDITINP